MNIEQLQQAIKEKFQSNGGTRIVFWYDGEKAFYESLNELNFDDVTVLNMENQAALEIKELLEIKDTIGSYLLYFQPVSRLMKITGCWIYNYTREFLPLIEFQWYSMNLG